MIKIVCIALLFIVSGGLHAVTYTPLPKNINELINTSDLIVIGSIGKVVDKREFYGYGRDQKFMAIKDAETPFSLGLPLVDFSINVEEILMDDLVNTQARDEVGEIVYRVFLSDKQLSEEMESRKEKVLLFLTRNPDNKTYGVTSLMHHIILKDKQPSYVFNGKEYELPFNSKSSSINFINKIKKSIKVKGERHETL